jgi:non-heme chloroperoxidase
MNIPTLILQGDADQIVPIEDASFLSAKLVKSSVLKVIPGAPHGLCTTHADQVNEELLAFLKT